ncbi:MAG: hypothetical protein ACREQ5_01510 [Candidatus Dormibacteria bacterium]
MNYALLVALGLLFLAVSFLVVHPTGRIIAVVLAAVMFLLASVAALLGAGVLTGG